MSVENQINRIKANIANAYAKAAEKGADLPAVQNSENLPAVIEGIPAGGLPEGMHTITLQSVDTQDGTVSGSGIVQNGVSIAAVATPADGYKFIDWKEGSMVVSKEAVYVFPVDKDRNLTAEFLSLRVAARAGVKE